MLLSASTTFHIFFLRLLSISPTFYEQLLCSQIPNAQKIVKSSVFFALLGPVCIKAAHKTLVKLTPDRDFCQRIAQYVECGSDQGMT